MSGQTSEQEAGIVSAGEGPATGTPPARLDDVRLLVEQIGPRLPGSAGERRAAQLVQSRLQAEGIPSTLLPVRTSRGEAPVYVVLLALIALGLPLAWLAPLLGFLVALAGALLLGAELATFPLLSRFLVTRPAHNVLGVVPARGNSGDEPALRVILLAHLDTARGVSRHALSGPLQPAVLVVLLAAGVMPPALLLAAIGDWLAARLLAGLAFVVLGLAVGAVALRLARGPFSPGALDNASGVAAVLGAMRALNAHRPRQVETWALFTAGAEDGLTGTIQFLNDNQFDPERTYFVDVDRVGAGHLCYVRATGVGYSRTSSERLTGLAERTARAHPEWQVDATTSRWFGAEFAALIRGYQALAITSCRAPRRWRDLPDTVDNLQHETIEQAAALLLALVRGLDVEAGERAPTRREPGSLWSAQEH